MKKNIAILAGGNSSEYFISLQSAETVAKGLSAQKYNVYTVLIKNKEWTLQNQLNCSIVINKNDFSFNDNGQKTTFDCVVSEIHGRPGEDGRLQGYFDMLNVPYIGCSAITSALTFNKFHCNIFLKNFGINIAKAELIKAGIKYNKAAIINTVGLPCFVKPNAGGSSFGISKVKNIEDFDKAALSALEESEEAIIEEFIPGREITCCVYKLKGKLISLPLAEIISKNEFFDYQAKYNADLNEEIVPAPISAELTATCKKLSEKVYNLLSCSGIVRVDFILSGNTFFLLEINTIPGVTAESIVPKMIATSGTTIGKVMGELIEDRLAKNEALTYDVKIS